MRFNALRVGINEIDMDHFNIDYVLRRMLAGSADETLAQQLVPAIILHMEHEESLIEELGLPFPGRHRKDHLYLSSLFRSLQLKWQERRIDSFEFADEVNSFFLIHILEFDMKLAGDLSRGDDGNAG